MTELSRDGAQRDWDEFGILQAILWSSRSYDPKHQVGAVILDLKHSIVAAGYNGRGRGQPNERLSLEEGKSSFVHAEINCLFRLRQGMEPYTMYLTHSPCRMCAEAILAHPATIWRIVYLETGEYREKGDTIPYGFEILRWAGRVVEAYPVTARIDLQLRASFPERYPSTVVSSVHGIID